MLHVISVATSATPQQIVGMMPRARKVVARGKECNVIMWMLLVAGVGAVVRSRGTELSVAAGPIH